MGSSPGWRVPLGGVTWLIQMHVRQSPSPPISANGDLDADRSVRTYTFNALACLSVDLAERSFSFDPHEPIGVCLGRLVIGLSCHSVAVVQKAPGVSLTFDDPGLPESRRTALANRDSCAGLLDSKFR